MIDSESLFLKISETNTLHIKKISKTERLPPAVFIHGVAENGRIFYSNSMKGTAPFFAQKFTCYVLDLRGKGKSTPKIGKNIDFNHKDVEEDLNQVFHFINKLHPNHSQLWIAHSWGGVLVNSMFLRFPDVINSISGTLFFGVKRSISVRSIKKLIHVNLFYNFIFTLMGEIEGFVSDRFFGFDSEALSFHKDVVKLAKVGKYIGPSDSFRFEDVAQTIKLPKCLTIAAIEDTILGSEKDVKDFVEECRQDYEFWMLSKKNGNKHDYDHNSMLTHPDAPNDHLPNILTWINKNLTID